jgi:hypothetical protein
MIGYAGFTFASEFSKHRAVGGLKNRYFPNHDLAISRIVSKSVESIRVKIQFDLDDNL